MRFMTGDIVRYKKEKGLFEVTDTYNQKAYDYTITNNECDSEKYVKAEDLIMVCGVDSREDI